MFFKYFSHEFKNTYKLPLIVCLLFLLDSLLIGIGQYYEIDALYDIGMSALSIILIISIISFYISIHKTLTSRLFTRGGYLTLTLPIGTHTILWSKILVNFIYSLWYSLAFMIGVFAIMAGFGVFDELLELFSYIGTIELTGDEVGYMIVQVIFLLLTFVSFLCFVLLYNAFINSGYIKTDSKFLKFILLIISLIILSNVMSIIIIPYYFVYDSAIEAYQVISIDEYDYQTIFIDFSSLFWAILLGVGSYLGSYFLIKNKIDIT